MMSIPFEAVNADHGVAAGDVLQLLRHLVGIVRQRLDLLARHRAAKGRTPIGCRLSRVARDGHRILEALNRQHRDVLVVARLQLQILQDAGLEARELGLDRIAARRQPGHRRNPLVVGRRGLDRGARDDRGERHLGVRDHRAGLIDDRHRNPRVLRRLAGWPARSGGDGRQREEGHQDCNHRFVLIEVCGLRTSSDRSSR
jgi:hypothetical protein